MYTIDQCPPEVRELHHNLNRLQANADLIASCGAKVPEFVLSALSNRGVVSAFTRPVKRGALYSTPPSIEDVKRANWLVCDAVRRVAGV